MSDEVSNLARLAAEVCFARNRSTDEAEKQALNLELDRYLVLLAAAREEASCNRTGLEPFPQQSRTS
jgi:hypothetical protein